MDYKIIAPNKNYNGESAGVNFVNGVGIAKDGKSIEWFKKKGYKVELMEPKESEKGKKAGKKEAGDMNDSSGNSTEKTKA